MNKATQKQNNNNHGTRSYVADHPKSHQHAMTYLGHVPNAEVMLLAPLLSPDKFSHPVIQARYMIAYNRHSNRICNRFRQQKSSISKPQQPHPPAPVLEGGKKEEEVGKKEEEKKEKEDDGCRNGTMENLIECIDCHLTFWCSEKCKQLDLAQHKQKWCMRLDDPLAVDDGPLKMFLAAVAP
jgi:hypothetical protein